MRSDAVCSKGAETNMFDITIDGRRTRVFEGATILQAAAKIGIEIPTLCYLAHRSHIASCRICVVEVAGSDYPVPACSTLVEDGMEVTTQSDTLDTYRRCALELIMADHGIETLDDCATCAADGACELQDMCIRFGFAGTRYRAPRNEGAVLDENPFLAFDPKLCIRCERCIGACNNGAHNHVLQAHRRGARTTIEAPFGEAWKQTTCESCGECAQACPTGAISLKRQRSYDAHTAKRVLTTCPHCGVGCQMNLIVDDGRIVDAEAAAGPSNKQMLCVKGRSGSFDFVDSDRRLRTPLIKNPRTGKFEEATWDDAFDLIAWKFNDLRQQYGGQSIAAFASSRSTNEDIYLFQKMARVALRTTNIDNCARV